MPLTLGTRLCCSCLLVLERVAHDTRRRTMASRSSRSSRAAVTDLLRLDQSQSCYLTLTPCIRQQHAYAPTADGTPVRNPSERECPVTHSVQCWRGLVLCSLSTCSGACCGTAALDRHRLQTRTVCPPPPRAGLWAGPGGVPWPSPIPKALRLHTL